MTSLTNPPPSGAGEQGRYEAIDARERALHETRRRLAVHSVARHAEDRRDCVELLEMLGLDDLVPEARPAVDDDA